MGMLMLASLAVAYAASRRLVLTVLVGTIVVGVFAWAVTPRLAATTSGDADLITRLHEEQSTGALSGFHDLAVVMVDTNSLQPVHIAGVGAASTTRMEIGSITKAMTGLVIADEVQRGELRLDVPVSAYLPQLAGSEAGEVTLSELVTHTAGYSEFGGAAIQRGLVAAPFGRTFLGTDLAGLMREARAQRLVNRGHYTYSTIGAAIAGQAAAAAAGMGYLDLMRTRLFEPLGMNDTVVQETAPLVSGGFARSGLLVEPWTLNAYAPGGGAVSSAIDLAKLATALLDGTAPGMAALEPKTATTQSDTRVGTFWHTSVWSGGQVVTWHGGQTGGYTSYFGLDRTRHRAVIVLSDVATPATDALGIALLRLPQ
jgi:CubicO group peptidase (beta-lactamase class C family)